MEIPLSLRQRAARKLPRLVKYGRRWARVPLEGGRPRTRVIFVVGSGRSGTRVPLTLLDHSPDVITYSEGSSPFFRNVLLQPLSRVAELLEASPFPVVALKPICETHRIIELLDRFPGSRCVWIFRRFTDAVNSASAKWKSGKEQLRRLAERDLAGSGWRSGGLTEAKLDEVKRLFSDDMSKHAANAVFWYLRNGLFFDLGVNRRPDVQLIKYEDIVTQPGAHVSRMFDFLGLETPNECAKSVYRSSVSRRPFPEIPTAVRSACEQLEARLLSHYESTLDPRKDEGSPTKSHAASLNGM